jgi:hypothetical protein
MQEREDGRKTGIEVRQQKKRCLNVICRMDPKKEKNTLGVVQWDIVPATMVWDRMKRKNDEYLCALSRRVFSYRVIECRLLW